MRVLVVGDIVGRPGRRAVKELLPGLVRRLGVDFTLANAENAAGGMGITRKVVEELLACGVDVLTTGNHVWQKKEVMQFIDGEPRVLRPANYPPGTPGRGLGVFETRDRVRVAVLNLLGRVFVGPVDCPFRCADELLRGLGGNVRVVVVDFHAEATSEKAALAWYLDGRVSAVVGTHTHVQTADERVLPGGTAYITDVGMTGPRDSVIGMKKEIIVERFLTQLPSRFEVATGPFQFNAVVVDVDPASGRAVAIARVAESE
ncbi:MAG: TIGR00282 family metallophosphoesterase [Firmicutes bacterium]|nr:TIGR00282 family metallophosphoesterase [Bacillota bacterium]